MADRNLDYYKGKTDPKSGLVPMMLLRPQTPWNTGDIAGFLPEVAMMMEAEVPPMATSDVTGKAAKEAANSPAARGERDKRDDISISPTWAVMPAVAKLKLASEIKGVETKEIKDAKEASAIIEEELARRDASVRAQTLAPGAQPVGVAAFNQNDAATPLATASEPGVGVKA